MSGVVGFVAAGGPSRRMGRDKALLPWEDTTLLDHALARLGQACSETRLLPGSRRRYTERGVPLVLDAAPGQGPLAGVAAGLVSCADRAGLFLAVDLPLVPVGLLRDLAERAGTADAVVPVSPSGPEPLCAVYGPRCLEPIMRRLAAGERKMTCFWPDVDVCQLGVASLRRFGDPERLFLNLNSPADLPPR